MPPPATASKVTLPRHAPGFVSPPARSARVTGSRTGTACEPVVAPPAPRELAHAEHLRPGELRDRQRGLGLGRLGQRAADLAWIDRLHRDRGRGHDAELGTRRERARDERVELRRAHDRPRDARAPDRLLLRELGLVVAPADAVDADDRDADVMPHARLRAPRAAAARCRRRAPCGRRWRRRRPPRRRRARRRGRCRRAGRPGTRGARRDSTRTSCPRRSSSRAASAPTVPVPPTIAILMVTGRNRRARCDITFVAMPWGFTRDDLRAQHDEAAKRTGRRRVRAARRTACAGSTRATRRCAGSAPPSRSTRRACWPRGAGKHWTARAAVRLRAAAGPATRTAPGGPSRTRSTDAEWRGELEYLLGRLRGGEGLYGALAGAATWSAIRAERERLVALAARPAAAAGLLARRRWTATSNSRRPSASRPRSSASRSRTTRRCSRRAGLLLDAPPAPPGLGRPARGRHLEAAPLRACGRPTRTGPRTSRLRARSRARRSSSSSGTTSCASPTARTTPRARRSCASFAEALEMAGDMLRAEGRTGPSTRSPSCSRTRRASASSSTARRSRPTAMPRATPAVAPARTAGSTSRKQPGTRSTRRSSTSAIPSGRGWLMRLSGDEDGARQAFERALAHADDDAAQAPPALRARPLGRRAVARGGRPCWRSRAVRGSPPRSVVVVDVGTRGDRRAHPHGTAAAGGLGGV